ADLARRYARVGVISGRPVSFLLDHLGGRGVELSGLYGLEWATAGDGIAVHPDAARWRTVVEEVATTSEAHGPAGMLVERKGLSVTLHYRADPEQHDAVRRWAEAEGARAGLVVHVARKSYELRP